MINDELKFERNTIGLLAKHFNFSKEENSHNLTEIAEMNFQEKNYLKALNYYLKILTYNPYNARIWNKIAVCFIQLGEFRTAEEMSRIAFKLINKEACD